MSVHYIASHIFWTQVPKHFMEKVLQVLEIACNHNSHDLNVLFQYKTPDFMTNVNDLTTKDYLSNLGEFSIFFNDPGVICDLFHCSL